ncbi:MAG: hypothetical protein JSR61_02645 [Proteobacteria bacterium]|nr:hypothetical protein [Pseudomonadota bacterium]
MSTQNIGDVQALKISADRLFAHHLLLELVNSGALKQAAAAAVCVRSAENIRDLSVTSQIEPLRAHLAIGYEHIAAAMLGRTLK